MGLGIQSGSKNAQGKTVMSRLSLSKKRPVWPPYFCRRLHSWIKFIKRGSWILNDIKKAVLMYASVDHRYMTTSSKTFRMTGSKLRKKSISRSK